MLEQFVQLNMILANIKANMSGLLQERELYLKKCDSLTKENEELKKKLEELKKE